MTDTTYINQAAYHKQGGNELVIANGGQETIESGGNQVVESGGKVAVESGGELEIQAGATFDVQTGAGFTLVDTLVTADQLKLFFLARNTITQYGSASITGSIVPGYGYHVFSAATGASLLSMTVPKASKGNMLYLDGGYLVGDGNISWLTESATGLVVNRRGSDLSSFEMSAAGYLKLVCAADGTWTVVEQNNITEHASS